MQNICKTLRSIDMKKIKKYVVFKYEDEFEKAIKELKKN